MWLEKLKENSEERWTKEKLVEGLKERDLREEMKICTNWQEAHTGRIMKNFQMLIYKNDFNNENAFYVATLEFYAQLRDLKHCRSRNNCYKYNYLWKIKTK